MSESEREPKRLPVAAPEHSALGRATIMDPALAQRHGVTYVHLAAFAIDIDRVREHLEETEEDVDLPFGWDVMVTEQHLLTALDPLRRPEHVHLLEDVVLGVIDGEGDVLGAQIIFAVWDAIVREQAPQRLSGAFKAWKTRPKDLVKELSRLWPRDAELLPRFARALEAAPIQPPISPPTRAALAAWA